MIVIVIVVVVVVVVVIVVVVAVAAGLVVAEFVAGAFLPRRVFAMMRGASFCKRDATRT